jgi:hypothetical protein
MANADLERPLLDFRCEWHTGEVLGPANRAAFAVFDVGPVEPDEVGLPPKLGKRLERLATWYDQSLDEYNPGGPRPWRQEECDRFTAEARALFEEIRARLADRIDVEWGIETLVEDPGLDEYLRDPDAYWHRKHPPNTALRRWKRAISSWYSSRTSKP